MFSTLIYVAALPVSHVDLLKERNERAHHTNQFHSKDLVIRRGQHLYVDIHLKKDYKKDEHDFQIVLKTGQKPRQSDRSKVVIRTVDNLDKAKWGMVHGGTSSRHLQMKISIPADAIVSKYSMTLESAGREVYQSEHKVFLLFNPWVHGMSNYIILGLGFCKCLLFPSFQSCNKIYTVILILQ